ncbi:hypothetical protein WAI453_013704 [Rhynchosporium graminicola]
MERAAAPYSTRGLLVAYNNHTVVEADQYSEQSPFWQTIYETLEKVDCHYSAYGLIHDNTVTSIGSAASSDNDPNTDQRRPTTSQESFLDSYFTTQSKSAGKVRAFTLGIGIRIKNRRTREIAYQILNLISFGGAIRPRD